MALGKPVIASWVAGIPELVTDEISGLLFRPSDWIHLSRQMRRLAEDPELRSRLGTAAKDAVFPEYDVKHSVVTIARLLREVTTSRPSG